MIVKINNISKKIVATILLFLLMISSAFALNDNLGAINSKERNKNLILKQIDEFFDLLKKVKLREKGSTNDLLLLEFLNSHKGTEENPALDFNDLVNFLNRGVIKIRKNNQMRGKVFEIKLGDKEYGDVFITRYTDNDREQLAENYIKLMGKMIQIKMMAHRIWSIHPTAPFSNEDEVLQDSERIKKIKDWLLEFYLEKEASDEASDEARAKAKSEMAFKKTILNYFYADETLLNGSPFFMGVNYVKGNINPNWWRYDLVSPTSVLSDNRSKLALKEEQLWSSRNANGLYTGLSRDNFSLNAQDKFDLSSLMLGKKNWGTLKTNLSFEVIHNGRSYRLIKYVDEDDIFIENRNSYLIEITLSENSISGFLGQKIEQLQSDALATGPAGVDGGFLMAKQIIYRTHIHLPEIGAPKTEEDLKIVWPHLLEKAKELPIPYMAQYDDFKTGDEIVSRVEGEIKGQFILSAYIGKINDKLNGFIQGRLKGQFDIGMRKLPNNRVEVSIQPQVVRQVGGSFDLFGHVGLNAESAFSILRKQVIQFDLDYETGNGNNKDFPARRAFLKLALWGELPFQQILKFEKMMISPLNAIGHFSNKSITANKLLNYVYNRNNEFVKKGMRISYLENIDIGYLHLNGHLKLPVPSLVKDYRPTLKGGKKINFRYINGSYQRLVTNGQVAISEKSFTKEMEDNNSQIKEIAEEVSATIHAFHGMDTEEGNLSTVDSILIEAKISNPMLDLAGQASLIRSLNDKFPGLWLGPTKDEIQSIRSRKIYLQLKVTAEDFNYLEKFGIEELNEAIARVVTRREGGVFSKTIERGMTNIFGGIHEIDISDSAIGKTLSKLGLAANSYKNLESTRIKKFLESIAKLGTTRQKANVLANLIKDYGLDAFSMVYILLGSDSTKLYVRTESDYYQITKEVDSFIDYYIDYNENRDTGYKFDHRSHDSDIQKMFSWAIDLRGELIRALISLHFDPFLLNPSKNLLKEHISDKKYQYLIDNGVRETREIKASEMISSLEKIDSFMHFINLSDQERAILYQKAQNKKALFVYRSDLISKDLNMIVWRSEIKKDLMDVVDWKKVKKHPYKINGKKELFLSAPERFYLLKEKYGAPLTYDLTNKGIDLLIERLVDVNTFLQSLDDEQQDLYETKDELIRHFKGSREELKKIEDKNSIIKAFSKIAHGYKAKRIKLLIELREASKDLIEPQRKFFVESENLKDPIFFKKVNDIGHRLKLKAEKEKKINGIAELSTIPKGRARIAYELFRNIVEDRLKIIDHDELIKRHLD